MIEPKKIICAYTVGYDKDGAVRCGEAGKERQLSSSMRKIKYFPLCDIHFLFVMDAKVKGLFLNGKYRPMKEVKEIVKRERVT